MSVRNHFGSSCHGDQPNLFQPGTPLDFSLLHQMYGEEGDGTDLGFYNSSDYIPIDEVSEADLHPDLRTEEDDWWPGMSMMVDFPDLFDNRSNNDLKNKVLTDFDECLCISQCGCNHKNRSPEVHSKKTKYRVRRSHNYQRRLARSRRSSIRRFSPEVFYALLA